MKRLSTILMLALAFALVATTASAAGDTFTKTLKKGSRGTEVSALQTLLASKGFLSVSPTGYFGNLTVAAVRAYQTSKGIAAVGQVGPATRAALNLEGATVGTLPAGCQAGWVVNPMTGASCTTTTTGGTTSGTGITTPGAEGTLTVSAGPVSNTNLYVGNTKAQVLNLKLQAQNSDISAQRVQVDLGTNSAVYTKAFTTLYVIGDNGAVLASTPLNMSTVVKSGTNYYVTIAGFNYLISKNTSRYLTVAVDVAPSVDNDYRTTYTVTLAPQGVRGVDGAGVVQYTGTGTQPSQAVLINASLSDSANLKLSTNSSTPLSTTIVADSGSTKDQADKVTVLAFNVKAERDSLGITDLVATTTMGGAADLTGAYLYDGSTLVASAAVPVSGVVTFSNIGGTSGYVVPKDTTKTFTLQVDVRSATSTPGTLTATIAAAGITAQNSQGTSVATANITGSATSNNLYVQSAGPVFALIGTPSISKSIIGTSASSTFATGFTFSVAARGTDVSIASTGAFVIGIYVNGVQTSTTTATYIKPTTGVTGNGPYVIADGQSATFTAQTSFIGPQAPQIPAGGIVSARMEGATVNSVSGYTYLAETFRAEPSTPITL